MKTKYLETKPTQFHCAWCTFSCPLGEEHSHGCDGTRRRRKPPKRRTGRNRARAHSHHHLR